MVNLRKFKSYQAFFFFFFLTQCYEIRYQLQGGKCKKKNTNTWRLNNTLLNNQEVTEEVKEEMKKHLETDDNKNTTQSRWVAAKAVLSEKFKVIQACLKKQENHQIHSLSLHLKQLEKEQKTHKTVEGNKS